MSQSTQHPGWGPPPSPTPRPKRHGRVFRWVVLAINALFLIWLIASLAHPLGCENLTGDELDTCVTGEAVGSGIVMFLIIGLWALVDVILGVVYLVLRDRR